LTFDHETENSPTKRTLYPEFVLTSNNLLACQIPYNAFHYSYGIHTPNTNIQFTTETAVYAKATGFLLMLCLGTHCSLCRLPCTPAQGINTHTHTHTHTHTLKYHSKNYTSCFKAATDTSVLVPVL